MATAHMVHVSQGGTSIKLHRGERKCLVGMDLDPAKLSDDFAGFALEYREPQGTGWKRMWNRLQFSYAGQSPEQRRKGAPSTEAPIQKFRWNFFPHTPREGEYRFRATPMFHGANGLVRGATSEAAIDLRHQTHPGLDIGFTRGYASSQAYADKARFPCQSRILPADPDDLEIDHPMAGCETEYAWLGFEARETIYGLLDEALNDPAITVDALLYELREPQLLARLQQLGNRLRAIVDDHGKHGDPGSNETVAAARLRQAGASVKRGHFDRQQHNKVLILRRGGTPIKALGGSANFTLRGLYIQSNNALVFSAPAASALFGKLFDAYWAIIDQPAAASQFRKHPLATIWHDCSPSDRLLVRIAFSPHRDPGLSLNPVADAIIDAEHSVFYAMVFLSQLTGRVRSALDGLMARDVFSYGTAQRRGALAVQKPDGSTGLATFAYLRANAPAPFSAEWSGGMGNTLHHKFIVTDFDTPNPRVFTGSSNMAAGGEKANGDHLIWIEDGAIATAYAVEALRNFDHFHFRSSLEAADQIGREITLAGRPQPGQPAWWAPAYAAGNVKQRDRLLFSRPV
jgi:hypothetical protein